MSDRAIVIGLRAMALAGAVLSGVSTWLVATGAGISIWFTEFDAFIVSFVWFFAVFVWLVAARQPRNAVVWIMAAAALFGSLSEFGPVAAWTLFDIDPELLMGAIIPASLPSGAAIMFLVFGWMWAPALLPPLTLGLLLFPDGRPPTRGWRWVGWVSVIGIVAVSGATIWSYRPSSTSIVEEGALLVVSWSVVVVAAVLSLVSLVGRFRRSSGETRQQLKWVIWGASVFIPALLVFGFIFGGGPYEHLLLGPVMAAEAMYLLSYGMALGRYRLYDIDLVISRTFVYGLLAAFIGVVYVAIVVGIGYALGVHDEPNVVLGLVATVVVAISFQPLRRRLQQVANRIVYGRRATPYEVLSTFSQRVAAVDPEVLTQIARSLAEGTTASGVSIWMNRPSGPQRMASWPAAADGPPSSSAEHRAPVFHDGEELGLIILNLSPGQPFTPVDAKLLDQVAAGLGLALRNLKMTEDLKTRVEELRDSRRRIVAVQDMTRRRLERDLHDGAQQRLVALKIKLGIGSSMATNAGLGGVESALTELREDTDQVIDMVRDFARGIYPPLLEADGLRSALAERARRMPVPTTVQAAGVVRYTREIEAAVYFCVLEALHNAVKHSRASSIHVTLDDRNGALAFEVRDDGIGFDPAMRGPGITTIADRLDSLGGVFDLETQPGRGTVVSGRIPVPELVGT